MVRDGQVGECCQQWKSAPAPGKGVESLPSSFSVAHLGSHILEDLVGVMDYTKRNGPSRDPSKFDILAWLSSAEDGASPYASGASDVAFRASNDAFGTAQSKKNSFLLRHARELVTIVPWPLHDRLRCAHLRRAPAAIRLLIKEAEASVDALPLHAVVPATSQSSLPAGSLRMIPVAPAHSRCCAVDTGTNSSHRATCKSRLPGTKPRA